MKNIKRKIISTVTALSLLTALSTGCVIAKNDASADGIKVTYDGETIEFDVQPEIINDRVMVPMRAIFEAFGAKVKWDGDTETITSKKKSKTITMTIGSTDMTKNDETYSFDVSPVIEDGRTLVPIRAISEMLGLDVEWDEDSQTVTIVTPEDEDDDTWKENTGTIELGTMKVTGDGISVSDNVITITEGGDFTVTGVSENGQIVIDTEDKVKLRLSGMSLTNPTGSAIYVKNADKAYITITDGTDNTLTDGETYTSGDENEKGTITSRDNLEIKGKGSLTINGNYKNGIDASDSLDIENGTITINAVNDGINVNDTLAISGGTLNVTAESDGLQAGDIVDITGGTINITTTGEVQSSSSEFGFGRGMQQTTTTDDTSDDVTSKGIKADWLIDISGGTINLTTTDHAIHSASDIEISGGDITIASDNKGISAHGDLTVDGGTIDITKSTEGIESKAIMTINDGDISVIASDDGLNAGGSGDMFGSMGGGNMGGMREQNGENLTSGENGEANQNFGERGMRGQGGMTSQRPNMQNGDMQQMTPPDGMTPPEMNGEMPADMQQGGMGGRGMMAPPEMNGEMPADMQQGGMMTPPDMQNGANSESSTEQRGGMQGGFGGGMGGMSRDSGEISTEHHIQINGGTLYINAMGDGIDSNGSIVIDGGTVTVDGTTSGGNSALDHDGTMMVNGGTLIAVSAIGMVEAPGSYSTQNVLNYTLTNSAAAGTEISVKNSSGKTIASHKSANAYQSFIFSSDELKTGETYTIYVDGEEADTFTVSSVITTAGTSASGSGTGFDGGRGGMRGMQQDTQTIAN